MLILVSGGSASGKSEFAEGAGRRLRPGDAAYLATMQVWDAESERRVERHRRMRAGKGFATVECPVNLAGAVLPAGCAALLEDLSNLTANEFFGPQGREGAFGRCSPAWSGRRSRPPCWWWSPTSCSPTEWTTTPRPWPTWTCWPG